MANYTEEQMEEMRRAVAADDKRKADELAAKREAYLAPVKTLVASSAWATVLDDLTDMTASYEDDGNLSVHVNALVEIMPRLAQIAGVNKPQAVEPSDAE